jgi:lysozyme
MTTNAAGLQIIKDFEGLKLQAYRDPVNIWTIGYGHTGREAYPGNIITKAKAEELLKEDLRHAEAYLKPWPWLNQNQFSALASFGYNVGRARWGNTLLSALNRKDPEAVAAAMLLYNKAGGQTLAGLARRREAEAELFLTRPGATAPGEKKKCAYCGRPFLD